MLSDQSNTALLPHKPALFIGEGGRGGCFLFGAMDTLMGFWVWKFSPKSDPGGIDATRYDLDELLK